MPKLNLLAAIAAISLAGGVAVAKDKPVAPKGKKVCVVVEPAVGRIPAKRVCTVKTESETAAAKAKGAEAQGPDSGGAD
ncbi:MAG TPA: hypothetical protein VF688_04140 [Allosphingosinicella sp.]|jgi:hypothetical protein